MKPYYIPQVDDLPHVLSLQSFKEATFLVFL
jgi:hypothetical protein